MALRPLSLIDSRAAERCVGIDVLDPWGAGRRSAVDLDLEADVHAHSGVTDVVRKPLDVEDAPDFLPPDSGRAAVRVEVVPERAEDAAGRGRQTGRNARCRDVGVDVRGRAHARGDVTVAADPDCPGREEGVADRGGDRE